MRPMDPATPHAPHDRMSTPIVSAESSKPENGEPGGRESAHQPTADSVDDEDDERSRARSSPATA